MLKMTEIELELNSHIDMSLFTENRMRGGISCITKRYFKENNKTIQSCDNSIPSKYIMYLDANDLYQWAMSQYLPYAAFKWLNQKEIDNLM